MKLVTYQVADRVAVGLLTEDSIVDLSAVAPDMISLIESGESGLARAKEIAAGSPDVVDLADAKLLAPIPTPRRRPRSSPITRWPLLRTGP